MPNRQLHRSHQSAPVSMTLGATRERVCRVNTKAVRF